MITILLCIAAVIVIWLIAGSIRVIWSDGENRGFWNTVMEFCFLDVLLELFFIILQALFEMD